MTNRNQRIGQTIGSITIIAELPSEKGSSAWLCECRCGNRFKKLNRHIRRKDNWTGCVACNRGSTSYLYKGYKEITGTYWARVQKQALDRDITFNLEIEEAYLLFDGFCYYTNLPIELGKTASLDRTDSLKGYSIDNVQWVHKDINRMKNDFSDEYFRFLCQKVKREPDVPEIK